MDFDKTMPDAEEEAGVKKKPPLWRRILEIVGLGVFAFILILIAVVSYLGRDPKEMKVLTWNDVLLRCDPEGDGLTVKKAILPDNYSKNGMFFITNSFYLENAAQWQFTLRYNNSAVENVMLLRELAEEPEEEVFVHVLRDNLGHFYTSYDYMAMQKTLHRFRRLVFDGVEMDGVTELWLDSYYAADVRDYYAAGHTEAVEGNKVYGGAEVWASTPVYLDSRGMYDYTKKVDFAYTGKTTEGLISFDPDIQAPK